MALIGLDWDGTLVDREQKPLPGALAAIGAMRAAGHKVMIYSCNSPKWIERCLNEFGVPVDYIYGKDGVCGKPNCDIFVDDRGYRFQSWDGDLEKILRLLK